MQQPAHMLTNTLKQEFGEDFSVGKQTKPRLKRYNTIHFSEHTQARQRQRGISNLQIAVMLLYGKATRTKDHALSISFNKPSRRKAQRDLGRKYAEISDRMNFYLILSNDRKELITVAHRTKRGPRA